MPRTAKKHRNDLYDAIESMHAIDMQLFSSIVEHVGPLEQWPLHQLTSMLSKHLQHQDRLSLTFFLLANRCPPDLYAQWLMQRRMLADCSASQSIARLIQEHKMGQLHRYTAYHLPFRVTTDKPLGERKHPWDGVGDPMPKDAPFTAYIFPIDTPDTMDTDGWRWDHAYAMLMQSNYICTLSHSVSAPAIHVVPVADPDEFEDPLDTYVNAHTATQVFSYTSNNFEATVVQQPATPPRRVKPRLTDAVEKRDATCDISELFTE